MARVKKVLKELKKFGYEVTEEQLKKYIAAGWCPSEVNGEYPEETAEELVGSFELQALLDEHKESGAEKFL